MPISLSNTRNTRIIRVGGLASLQHHGHETVRIERVDSTVEIDLCGHDTLTTRGKMDKFLELEKISLRIYRHKGQTYAADGTDPLARRWPIGGEHPDRLSFKIDGSGGLMWQIPNF